MQRTILITGSNGNLGQEVVNRLSSEGHQIIAVTGSGPIPEYFNEKTINQSRIDLSNESEAEAFALDMIGQHPNLDAALLLAGGFSMGKLDMTDEKLLDQQIALNFKTALFIIKPLLAHFIKSGGGQFILMGARPAISPDAGKNSVAYAISKSMLLSLAEIINAEGKESGITASVIIPSILDTPPNRKSMPKADYSTWIKPSRVADTISFILSDAGRELRQPVFKIYNQF
jgi:NAD(P)-dependent dehydrogenase (short-subunit alcohol dehydrogenase family)